MIKRKPTKKLTKKPAPGAPKQRKKCHFCRDKGIEINYKDVNRLRNYISERGKILHRRITKNCAKHQRAITLAIKQARNLALLPYTVE